MDPMATNREVVELWFRLAADLPSSKLKTFEKIIESEERSSFKQQHNLGGFKWCHGNAQLCRFFGHAYYVHWCNKHIPIEYLHKVTGLYGIAQMKSPCGAVTTMYIFEEHSSERRVPVLGSVGAALAFALHNEYIPREHVERVRAIAGDAFPDRGNPLQKEWKSPRGGLRSQENPSMSRWSRGNKRPPEPQCAHQRQVYRRGPTVPQLKGTLSLDRPGASTSILHIQHRVHAPRDLNHESVASVIVPPQREPQVQAHTCGRDGACAYNTGLELLENGELSAAFIVLKGAANKSDHAGAKAKLGWHLLKGLGVTQDVDKGLEWLKQAAEQGESYAQFHLGECYAKGEGVEADPATSLSLFEKAAVQGHLDAQCRFASMITDPEAAKALFRMVADEGHGGAMFDMGCRSSGPESLEWYEKAAEKGCCLSPTELGHKFKTAGKLLEAFEQYKKAAVQGHKGAQYHLGCCYRKGMGVEANAKKAVVWFERAAEKVVNACYNLGVCYYEGGVGVEQNYEKAVSCFLKAAAEGFSSAQRMMGICYKNGLGVERNGEEAVAWFMQAADCGDAGAQFNLGLHHRYGRGAEKNPEEAVSWFRKAAEKGYHKAQYELGKCYHYGHGVVASIEDAVAWYKKAADGGHAESLIQMGEFWADGIGVKQS